MKVGFNWVQGFGCVFAHDNSCQCVLLMLDSVIICWALYAIWCLNSLDCTWCLCFSLMIICLKSLQLVEKGMVFHECNWKFFFLICMYVYYQSNFLCFFPQSPHYIWVFQIWFTSQFAHIQFSMKNSSMSKPMICDQLSIHLWYYIYRSFFNLLS